jgi:pimeloyl-ACP methyl ester carboxylesterase
MDERWVEVADTRLFIRSWGNAGGRPVLYWHGVSLTARASLTLNAAGPVLAERGFRALAPDAPGFGNSPPLERDTYHPHALADFVARLLGARSRARAVHGLLLGRRCGSTSHRETP